MASSTQPVANGGGAWAAIDDGMYTDTITNPLTTAVDPALTTVVAIYVSKDNWNAVANDVFIFVPAGGEPAGTHQVVAQRPVKSGINLIA